MSDRPANSSPIGLIGVGLVGSALAERFLHAGWQVIGIQQHAISQITARRDRHDAVIDSGSRETFPSRSTHASVLVADASSWSPRSSL